MSSLAKVWSEVENLLADNISLIPVRDKDETTKNGDVRFAKTSYGSWKEYQNRCMSKEELWNALEHNNTTAVAIVCGKVSGSLEVIDIDVKYNPGIDAILFADIKNFYPELFKKLRIHSTPSGGYHILYRIQGDYPVIGNLKLAGRYSTEEEIEAQIKRGVKRPNKEVNFLETRGEGGYVLAPPSLGYKIHQNQPIPVLTWEERCSLIRLCESYSEIIKVVPKPTPTKSEDSWYSENPFEHYNNTIDPNALTSEFGWKYSHENANFIWYTRPDKQRGVSLSWNKVKRIFYVFTSSTELAEQRGYNPSTFLAEMGFKGEKKDVFRWLVQNGYGIVKPSVEASVVKKAALSGKSLPANFSEEAQQLLSTQTEQLQKDHPFGVFIKYDSEEDKFVVSREALTYVAKNLGFRYYDGDLVRINGHIISFVSERDFQDTLKNYIHEEEYEEYEKLCNLYEQFMQKNGKYTMQRIELLDESLILKDRKNISYKYYLNGYLTITADEIVFNDYSQFSNLVWDSSIQKRNYNPGEGGKFEEYLKLAVIDTEQASKVMGYLAHEYKDETTGYIIVLTEQCPDPKQGGGSGKNVFCNLLRLTTTYTSKPGSQAKFDEKFFQSWNRQRIFGISDVPKNFDFLFLKEPATGSFIWKKLFKDEVEVSVHDAPKFVVQTNYSYEITDGGLKRRIIPLEFTNFFTTAGGLDVYFGCHFPDGWSEQDYAGFDNFIAKSIQLWIKGGNKLQATELTETGWLKQWEQTYGSATGFILANWDEWVKDGYITNDKFKKDLEQYFNDNNIIKTYWPSSQKLNGAIESYSHKHGYGFKKDFTKRVGLYKSKCRVFFPPNEAPTMDIEDEIDSIPF